MPPKHFPLASEQKASAQMTAGLAKKIAAMQLEEHNKAKAGKAPRRRAFGMDFVENTPVIYLVVVAVLLYSLGQHFSHPLDHLVGAELVLEPTRVIDGDTFAAIVQPRGVEARFRLRRVDAPELDQAFGNAAAARLEKLLLGDERGDRPVAGTDGELVGVRAAESALHGRDVEVVARIDAQDEWGRYVCDVVVRHALSTKVAYVQEALVADGLAWSFDTFGAGKGRLGEAMAEAKAAKRGLWSTEAEPVAPWVHRRGKKTLSDDASHAASTARAKAYQNDKEGLKGFSNKRRQAQARQRKEQRGN
jgi:endonuclease YncB( thermonuclease family)